MNLAGSAIWAQLKGGTALTALLAGGTATGTASIYEHHAATAGSMPYVVYNEQSAVWDYTMDAKRFVTATYLVKAVSGSAWQKEADLIDAQIDARLHNASLTVTGYGVLRCVREEDVRYSELEGDQTIHHVGALYRVDLYNS